MKPMDEMVRGLLFDGQFRFLAAVSTATAEEARHRHDLWPTAAAALGRSLTAAGLMAFDLKGEGAITLRIQGGGPLGSLVAQGRREEEASAVDVRGYVGRHHVDLDLKDGKLDVGRAVGEGNLYVVRHEGARTFTGAAPLVSGEIAEDLAYYFQQSEQRSTAVALGVLVAPGGEVQAAGGFIIERLPGAQEEAAAALEKGLQSLGRVTEKLRQGYGPLDLM
ncbi:MAG: Hsp33 family molecular chaperone HslO, partial [Bacillota bacterium]|nr:Hsp33 family molecular chaperone HslO [Bacillota bacterium]